MEQSYLELAQIVNTHGLRGDIKVVPWADYPEIFEEIDYVYTDDMTKYEITNVKYQKNMVILHLDKITSIEMAEKMKNMILYVRKEDMPPLTEGAHYVADLIGMKVIDENTEYGIVSDVLSYGATDIYEIKRKGQKNLLLPAAKEFILEVNMEESFIRVKLPDGLLEL